MSLIFSRSTLINDFYEDLDYASTAALLDSLEADAPLPVGSVMGRSGSEATSGATSLATLKPKQTGVANA